MFRGLIGRAGMTFCVVNDGMNRAMPCATRNALTAARGCCRAGREPSCGLVRPDLDASAHCDDRFATPPLAGYNRGRQFCYKRRLVTFPRQAVTPAGRMLHKLVVCRGMSPNDFVVRIRNLHGRSVGLIACAIDDAPPAQPTGAPSRDSESVNLTSLCTNAGARHRPGIFGHGSNNDQGNPG